MSFWPKIIYCEKDKTREQHRKSTHPTVHHTGWQDGYPGSEAAWSPLPTWLIGYPAWLMFPPISLPAHLFTFSDKRGGTQGPVGWRDLAICSNFRNGTHCCRSGTVFFSVISKSKILLLGSLTIWHNMASVQFFLSKKSVHPNAQQTRECQGMLLIRSGDHHFSPIYTL